jgi:hypothetical protein
MTEVNISFSLGINIRLTVHHKDLAVHVSSQLSSSRRSGIVSPSLAPSPRLSQSTLHQHNVATMTNHSSSITSDIDAQIERLRNGEALSELEVKNLCEQVCGKEQKALFGSHFHPFV